jgi:hypothetical protein
MKVKHLDELYTWRQIRKLQRIYKFNRHNGFLPIAIYSSSGEESYYSSRGDCYEWLGKQTPYYARMLWETARKRLLEFEGDALAFDIVEASECLIQSDSGLQIKFGNIVQSSGVLCGALQTMGR